MALARLQTGGGEAVARRRSALLRNRPRITSRFIAMPRERRRTSASHGLRHTECAYYEGSPGQRRDIRFSRVTAHGVCLLQGFAWAAGVGLALLTGYGTRSVPTTRVRPDLKTGTVFGVLTGFCGIIALARVAVVTALSYARVVAVERQVF